MREAAKLPSSVCKADLRHNRHMIQGAIFDVDGTLMDSMWIWEQAFIEFAQAHGIDSEETFATQFFSMSLSEGAHFIKRECGLSQSPAEITGDLAERANYIYMEKAQLKPNVYAFLTSLASADIPLTIVTSGEKNLVENVLGKLGVLPLFSKIYAATNEHISKREPDLWLRAQSLMGSSPEKTWVFEDATYAIAVTKQLGFRTVAIEDQHDSANCEKARALAELSWSEYPMQLPPEILH